MAGRRWLKGLGFAVLVVGSGPMEPRLSAIATQGAGEAHPTRVRFFRWKPAQRPPDDGAAVDVRPAE